MVPLSTQSGVGEIRYSLDGKAPTARSKRYARPLVLDLPATLSAAAFDGRARLAAPVTRALDPVTLRYELLPEIPGRARGDRDVAFVGGPGLVLRSGGARSLRAPGENAGHTDRNLPTPEAYVLRW